MGPIGDEKECGVCNDRFASWRFSECQEESKRLQDHISQARQGKPGKKPRSWKREKKNQSENACRLVTVVHRHRFHLQPPELSGRFRPELPDLLLLLMLP
ncbi:hypothetical protein OPV22_004074 [Ensete ventricosum]|uniref:Uncharacterized protein n=1 Tax=Ensete ventricosum TaxID=4639 RepID=A0AAV8S2Q5_ENSVE|nr:hypothetical protein OPV22_004074 [Ensete ventricosum]